MWQILQINLVEVDVCADLEEFNLQRISGLFSAAADEKFTVEQAVETIGFGRFHVLLFVIMGSANVSLSSPQQSCSEGGTSAHWRCVFVQIVEAMEIMLLAVVSPEIRCEWRLEDWQVALVSTVSFCHPSQTTQKLNSVSQISLIKLSWTSLKWSEMLLKVSCSAEVMETFKAELW